jgi:hypothetical protein
MAIFIYTMITLNLEYVKKNDEEYLIAGEIKNRYEFSIHQIRRKINQVMFNRSTIDISVIGCIEPFKIKPTGYAYGKITGLVSKKFLDEFMSSDSSKLLLFSLVMPYYDPNKFYFILNIAK